MYRKLLLATCLLAMPSMADSGVPPTDNPTTQTEEQGSVLSQPERQAPGRKLLDYLCVNKSFLCQWAIMSTVLYIIARKFTTMNQSPSGYTLTTKLPDWVSCILMLRSKLWWPHLQRFTLAALIYTGVAVAFRHPPHTWWAGGEATRKKKLMEKQGALDISVAAIYTLVVSWVQSEELLSAAIGEGCLWTLLFHTLYRAYGWVAERI